MGKAGNWSLIDASTTFLQSCVGCCDRLGILIIGTTISSCHIFYHYLQLLMLFITVTGANGACRAEGASIGVFNIGGLKSWTLDDLLDEVAAISRFAWRVSGASDILVCLQKCRKHCVWLLFCLSSKSLFTIMARGHSVSHMIAPPLYFARVLLPKSSDDDDDVTASEEPCTFEEAIWLHPMLLSGKLLQVVRIN